MIPQVLEIKKRDCDDLKGKFLDKSHYDLLINKDTDVYAKNVDQKTDESNVIVKFRKNIFTQKEVDLCYEGLIGAATLSHNRGIAAGLREELQITQVGKDREWVAAYQLAVLEYFTSSHNNFFDKTTLESIKKEHKNSLSKEEFRAQVWMISEIRKEHDPYFGWFDRWVDNIEHKSKTEQSIAAEYVRNNYISDTNYATSVMSGVAGYYSRYPRIPYGRSTAYTEKNPELFAKSFPFLNRLNDEFKNLLPERWAAQKTAANKLDKKFLIDKTVFTTLTVNHNWRTAAHLDAGDLEQGFSNLCTFGKGWSGAELILPEYRAAVDLQPGDLLLVANHTAIHSNAPLGPPFKGGEPDRMSLVAYFREDMFNLKSWEYECLRRQFVDERRFNKNHKEWRPFWNGVGVKMWESQEWKDYMKKHNMADPYADPYAVSSIEQFFSV